MMPLAFGGGGVTGFPSGWNGFVGFVEAAGSQNGVWLEYKHEGNPFEVELLSSDALSAFTSDYALSQSGELLEFSDVQAETLTEILNLNELLPGLQAQPWRALASWEHGLSGATHILLGGRDHTIAHCTRSSISTSWFCEEEVVSSGGQGEVRSLKIRNSGEAWVLTHDKTGASVVYSRDLMHASATWESQGNPACPSGEPSCSGNRILTIELGQGTQTVFALGEESRLIRRSVVGDWEDISPQADSGEDIDLRGFVEDEATFTLVGYERTCSLSDAIQGCVLESGRWWLFAGLSGGDGTVAWGEPALLFEESCGQGLAKKCSSESDESGPFSLHHDSESKTWMVTGSVWGAEGRRGAVFWKP